MRLLAPLLVGFFVVSACSAPEPPTAPVPSGAIAPWPVPSNESDLIHAAGQDDLTTGVRQDVVWQIHLDVYKDGVPVVVPGSIGIDWAKGFVAPIHTHLSAGQIDVESPVLRSFTLGQFFTMWGVSLDGAKAYVNGQLTADAAGILLAPHQELVVVFGAVPTLIPSTYPSISA